MLLAPYGLILKLETRNLEQRHGNIILFMPYLQYETHEKRKEMSNVIEKATARRLEQDRRQSMSNSSDQMLIHAYLLQHT